MATLILLAKTYWKQIALFVLVVGVLGYIKVLHLEVNHYREKAADLQTEIDTAKARQKAETERLQAEHDAITKQFADSLRRKGEAIMQSHDKLVTRIKAHEASKRVVLPPDVVELFNAGTEAKPEPPKAEQGNAGSTSPREEAVTKTLNDLLLVSAENNANHLKCINQVLDWQAFWREFEQVSRPAN